MTVYRPNHPQLIDTYKDVGTVTEVFHLNHQDEATALMDKYAGTAAIGHVRYATCGLMIAATPSRLNAITSKSTSGSHSASRQTGQLSAIEAGNPVGTQLPPGPRHRYRSVDASHLPATVR